MFNLWFFLVGNAIVCLIVSYGLWWTLPLYCRNRVAFLLLFVPGITLPVLSVLMPVLMGMALHYLTRHPSKPHLQIIGHQELMLHQEVVQPKVSKAAWSSLYQPQADQRLRHMALLAINSKSRIEANVMSQEILSFTDEELRLYAFHLVMEQRDQYLGRLKSLEDELSRLKDQQTIAQYHRAMALNYWRIAGLENELDSARGLFVKNAEYYAKNALEVYTDDSMLWALMGKVAHHRNDKAKAEQYFSKAFECRVAIKDLLPEYAEMLFKKHQMKALVDFWEQVSLFESPPYKSIKAYWAHYG